MSQTSLFDFTAKRTKRKRPRESPAKTKRELRQELKCMKCNEETRKWCSENNASCEKPRALKELESNAGEIDGLLKEVQRDDATFDVRNWRGRGINPEEIKIRFENFERLQADMFDKKVSKNHFPNVSGSRLFKYVIPRLKELGCPTERLIEVIMAVRENKLRQWADYLKGESEGFYRRCAEQEIQANRGLLKPETKSLEHLIDHEKWRKAQLEELGETFEPLEWITELRMRAQTV